MHSRVDVPTPDSAQAPPQRNLWPRHAIAVLAAIMASVLYLWLCRRYGRLASDLQYDDVTYALDAASRLDALHYGGVRGFLDGLAAAPPHSPFSTLLAFTGFAVAGLNDTAMYAANAVILVFAAIMVTTITARNGVATFLICLAIVLVSPLAYASIGDFRPDLMVGLATASMAWTFVSAGIDERPRRARLAGVLLGVCLLVKPTFFAHTLALSVMLAGISWLASWRIAPMWLRPLGLPVTELILFLAIGLLLSMPYYAFAFGDIAHYFWSNTLGAQGHIWGFPPGIGPMELFSRYIYPNFAHLPRRLNFQVAVVGILIFLAALAWRRQGRELLRTLMLVAIAVTSAASILAGHQASPYFFTTTHWTLVLALASAFAGLDLSVALRARHWLQGAVALVLALVVVSDARNERPDPMVAEARLGDSWNQLIIDAIRNDLALVAPGRSVVPYLFVPTANAVNAITLQWIGMRNGQPILAGEFQVESDIARLKAVALGSDYLVLPNPAREPYDRHLPIFPLQAPLLEWALAHPQLTRVDHAGDEAKFLVFRTETARRFAAHGVPDIALGAIQAEYGLAGERYSAPRAATDASPGYCFYMLPEHPAMVDVRFTADRPVKVELRNARGVLASTTLAAGEPGHLAGRIRPVMPWNNCLRLPSGGRLTIQSFEVRAAE